MGITLSSDKYTMEIADASGDGNIPICCSLGDYEYVLSDDPGIYLFKKKIGDKWLLYEGLLSEIVIKRNRLYLVPFIDVNDSLLEESSIEFNNFYDICNYIRVNINNNMLNIKLLEYSRKNIKANYLERMDSELSYDNSEHKLSYDNNEGL